MRTIPLAEATARVKGQIDAGLTRTAASSSAVRRLRIGVAGPPHGMRLSAQSAAAWRPWLSASAGVLGSGAKRSTSRWRSARRPWDAA